MDMKHKLNYWAFLAALTFFGYYFFTTFFEVFRITGSEVSYVFRGVICYLSILVIPKLYLDRQRYFFFWILLIAFFVYFVAIIKGELIYGAVYSKSISFVLQFYIFATLIPLLIFMRPDEINELEFARFSQILIVITLLFTCLNYQDFVEREMITNTRFYSEKINPIALGHLSLSLFILSFYSFKNNAYSNKVWLMFVLFSSVVFLLLSQSRGAFVSAFFVIFYYFLGIKNKKDLMAGLLFIILIIVSFVSYNFIYRFNYPDAPSAFDVILKMGGANDLSAQGRFLSFKGALMEFVDAPVFGKGIEEPFTHFYPHNLLLEILMSVGAFGGILFFIVFLSLFYKLVKNIGSPSVFHFLFIQYFIGGHVFWSIVFLIPVMVFRCFYPFFNFV